ncbi:MAG TPA: HAD-IC family P-type ATPase [Acidimicrobiales bacterium]|nr:HAD-IC family P-type ATPase [Acidimicrobiales bacterium]
MANRSAIVRRLAAVETLGSVTILATDKTGTLTEGRMVVVEAWTPYRSVSFTGQGYEPVGDLLEGDQHVDLTQASDVMELLTAAALCNDAILVAPSGEQDVWSGLGDPTEVALLAAAGKAGLSRIDLESKLPRLLEIPFDSGMQRMTTVHADGSGYRVVAKGSPEALITPRSVDGAKATPASVLQRASELASRGYRVLAVSSGRSGTPAPIEAEADLHLLGLVAITDPPRPTASRTIGACRAAGITPVLITGDHPATALAIAEQVGIVDNPSSTVVTGDQVRRGEVIDLTLARVFARTSPEQKLDIIRAWRSRGEVVAMTGDGVNDGPALRQADIGVAMGRRGTEVARQAADLVLADDELATVVAAVAEGRRVYANIRRFLIFGLAGGSAAIAVMLVGPLVGLAVPLLASQILWINLLTHGLTGVAMGAEPPESGAMNRPPQRPAQSILGAGLWQRVVRVTFLISAAALAIGVWGRHTDRKWQSLLFLALTSLELGVALGLRSKLWTRQNPYLPAAVAGSLLLALGGIYVLPLRDLLGTASLPASDAALATAVGALGWVAVRVDKRFFGREYESGRQPDNSARSGRIKAQQ